MKLLGSLAVTSVAVVELVRKKPDIAQLTVLSFGRPY
ncbi:hypothetical protein ABIF86_000328 [Bradyrhizobium japonicum]